jgi:hypothetical protein
MTDQNQLLMQGIRKAWGNSIAEASRNSSVPAAFLAALIAGESGGSNEAKRFERNVLASLWEVLLGRKASFGSIGRSDLVSVVTGVSGSPVNAPASLPADAFQRLDALANSWGLTQIMGYNAIGFGIKVETLKDPATGLRIATTMLAQFAHRFQLDVAKDFPPLFACWNTGGPDVTKTFDPKYCANGVMRMQLFSDILAAHSTGGESTTDPGT